MQNSVSKLVKWYEANKRPLPWRVKKPDPYHVWIAEIMSQQTQMSTLIPYFHRFLQRFPHVENLAQADEADVLKAWTGLGYYSRAKNVHKLAKKIVFESKGRFPKKFSDWLELPGVGPYTAAAVVSQCFETKEPVWDGNVLRVTSRLFARNDSYSSAFKDEMMQSLSAWIQNYSASSFNQAFMELGALVCTPKSPACSRCPLSSSCLSFLKDQVALYPPPKPRKDFVELKAKVWMLFYKEKVFLTQRKSDDWFSGMWDFPSELGGIKTPLRKLEFSLKEDAKKMGKTKHSITHHKIELESYKINVSDQKKILIKEGKWIAVDELLSEKISIPLSTTARKILKLYYKSGEKNAL